MPITRKSLARNRRRGTAEIELLLSVLVMITILMLVHAGAKIGLARLDAAQDAGNRALSNAATGGNPLYTNDGALTDVTTEWDIRPGLPTRTHVVRNEAIVPIYAGSGEWIPPAKVTSVAGAISPGWTMTGYPVASDEATMRAWFDQYIDESHIEVVPPLLMAPSWRP